MKKLQVKTPEGGWCWVFCRAMPAKEVMTCGDKQKALPSKAYMGQEDLVYFRAEFPSQTFRLAESLNQ